MKHARYLPLILLLGLLIFPTSAQDTDQTAEGWPVVERCIGEAVTPPDDWSFDGTIITTGWAGIHGINAAWDTPYILAFRNQWLPGFGRGTVSPDGRWFVVPQGYSEHVDFLVNREYVTRLSVYDLTDRRNILRLTWADNYDLIRGSGTSIYYTLRTPVWFDEDTFIYQRGETFYRIHVPDLVIEEWDEPQDWQGISPVWVFILNPSPDWSRIITRVDYANVSLFDTEIQDFIGVVYRPLANIDPGFAAWRSDSTEFLFSGTLSTQIHDADGDVLATVSSAILRNEYTIEVHNNTFIRMNAYSPDGTHFWLILRTNDDTYHLALANRAERIIIDTCVDSVLDFLTAQFSPDSRYLAYFPPRGSTQLQILDIENWQLYNTGIYHEGQILNWRADDEE